MNKRRKTIERKRKHRKEDESALAYESLRGFRTILGYVQRFSPEARRRMLAASVIVCR